MKTSDVSSNRPAQSSEPIKPEKKTKSQKEFKEVLHDSAGRGGIKKSKPFSPLEKKSLSKDVQTTPKSSKVGGEKTIAEQSAEHQRIQSRGDRDLEDGKSMKHSNQEELVPPMLPPTSMAPSALQTPTAVGKTQNPGLNIDEIQSIVKQVQVGVSEKGLPECRFELETKNLGHIDLKVNAENDKIRIEFGVQDAKTQQVLEENLKELQQMLQDKGLTLAETKFTPRDQDSEKQQQQNEESEQAYPTMPPSGRKKGFSL